SRSFGNPASNGQGPSLQLSKRTKTPSPPLSSQSEYWLTENLGLSAHVVGDVTTPPVSAGDLLASAGPGNFSTIDAICSVAKFTGARVALLTARPEAGRMACRSANAVAYIPAQTMADGEESGASLGVRLPMGSVYEGAGAPFMLFEMVVLRLAEVLGQAPSHLCSRHTNLE
ncbi:3-hexulose-6-phosphate isomerase-like, partial [Phoenix dactylifera]|uniref:3-hexulose-6-phosphate isomerase-like n=1 Tax=Phoenix dactylifera TaxID=42345 RepID=A0A8B7CSB4_PHODC